MSKDVRDITSWEELQESYPLAEVLSALHQKEQMRIYHKTAYLKRQERTRTIEAELKKRGIVIE